jgi:hypothetical protein
LQSQEIKNKATDSINVTQGKSMPMLALAFAVATLMWLCPLRLDKRQSILHFEIRSCATRASSSWPAAITTTRNLSLAGQQTAKSESGTNEHSSEGSPQLTSLDSVTASNVTGILLPRKPHILPFLSFQGFDPLSRHACK